MNDARTEQREFGPYQCRITASYVKLKALYLRQEAIRASGLPYGPVTIRLRDGLEMSAHHTGGGGITGLARLYALLRLEEGAVLAVRIVRSGNTSTVLIDAAALQIQTPTNNRSERVFVRRRLRHVHLEVFRPENLLKWEPAEEKDVFLAFGVLQEYSDFRYCCSTSKAVLRKLGDNEADATKPDAILIDLRTDEYVMSEWKMRSSAFAGNHQPADVDVLVCWDDDEVDRSLLPPDVVCLRDIARTAANSVLSEEELSE